MRGAEILSSPLTRRFASPSPFGRGIFLYTAFQHICGTVMNIGFNRHCHQRVSGDQILEPFHAWTDFLHQCGEIFAGLGFSRKRR